MANPNLELLKVAAQLLRPLVNELVFVGGCTTGLFITDEASADIRPTLDVDTIAEITSYAGYVDLSERLGNSVSSLARVKVRRFAAGFMGRRNWT